jgi:hypothetical protein
MWKIAALAVLFAAVPAMAQTVCSIRAEFIDQFAHRYAENPVAMGLASNGGVVEVLASEGGSWTLLVTMPNGVSCVVAAGENWEALPSALAGAAT